MSAQPGPALDFTAECERRGIWIATDLGDVLDTVMARAELPESWLPTGFRALDYLLDGGLRGGEMMLVAARPRMGKSALAGQMALQMAEAGHPVAIWVFEMSDEAYGRRQLAGASGVSNSRIRRGGQYLGTQDCVEMAAAHGRLHGLPVYFPVTGRNPDSFYAVLQQGVSQFSIQLAIIDYLQLMEPAPGGYSRENEVATISRTLKRAARDMDIPVMALSQLNRNAEGRPPGLADLRESGALEQDADIILFLHRDQGEDGRLADTCRMTLAKNREGQDGMMTMVFDRQRLRFREVER